MMTDRPSGFERSWWGAALIGAYVAIILSGLLVAALTRPLTDHGFVYELGRSFALVGLSILALQFVLAARLHWMERPFGLDIVFRFHRAAAGLALVLLAGHPVLLAAGGAGFRLVYGVGVPWTIWLGRCVLLLLIVQVLASLLRPILRLGFEQWRLLHNQATLIFGAGFIHARAIGGDFAEMAMRILWWGMLGIAVGAYGYHKLVLPAFLARHAYRVKEVKRESHNVWTLKMEPQGRGRLDFRPGQFHFIHLRRGRGLPSEEHPFTIASSPTQLVIESTIKESGDFTSTIGETRAGDRVSVRGPYGRFSCTYRSGERDLAFIAGGIGVTPIMSMLRHMRETRADVDVLLLYANRRRQDMVFREELEQIAAGDLPRLKIVHVLSEPEADWSGERGYVDRGRLEKHMGEGYAGKVYYVCGPPPMMKLVVGALRDMGVSAGRIEYEWFSL